MQDGTTDEVRLARMSDTLFIAVLGRDHNNNNHNHNTNFKSVFLHFYLTCSGCKMCCPKNTHAQHKTKPKFSAPVFKSRAGLTWPSLERKQERKNQISGRLSSK